MKKPIKILILIVFISMASLYARTITLMEMVPISRLNLETKPIVKNRLKLNIEEELKLKTHNGFLHSLGHSESSNRYNIVNRFGYMGKYQFNMATLKSLGYKITRKEFLNNPSLQEEAMDRLLTENFKSLRRQINKYEGTVIHGIYITKSGVLAAAHLGGVGNVKKWFRKGDNFKDGNGVAITTYMKKFANYNLDI